MGKVKLLSRREIDVAKSKDRQREIDEGTKLASRVDSLRELAADEDANLQKWRIQTVAQIQAEIDTLTKKRDKLANQVKEKAEEREALMRPLDKAWKAIELAKLEVDGRFDGIEEREIALKKAIALNLLRERENDDERERIEDERRDSKKALAEAERTNQTSKDKLEETFAMSNRIASECVERETAATERERSLVARDKELILRKDGLDDRERDIINRERKLADQLKTFIRNQNRKYGKR